MRVVVVVRNAAATTAGLIDDVRRRLEVDAELVWGGDPHLRPVSDRWIDLGLDRVGGVPAGVAMLAVAPELGGLVRALAALGTGTGGPVLVLDADRCALTGSLTLPTDAFGVVRRGVPPVDGASPSPADLAEHGPYGVAALSVPPSIDPAALPAVLDALVATGPVTSPGRALAAALAAQPVTALAGEVVGYPSADGPALHDLGHVDPDEPWHLTIGTLPPRVLRSDRVAAGGGDTWPVRPRPDAGLWLPGGIVVDATMRQLVAEAVGEHRRVGAPLPPDPWTDAAGFRRWLETPADRWTPAVGRYWDRLWHERRDLRAEFPDPSGPDLARFRRWAADRHRWERHSPLLAPIAADALPVWRDDGRVHGGVDVIGYFGTAVSLASVSDRIASGLAAAGLPHRTVDFRRSGSPRRPDGPRTDDALAHDTVIVVANPDQVPALLAERAELLAGRRLIGFWHWDVEFVPASVIEQMRHFEQIWVLNDFTERSLGGVAGAPPVRSLPLPVAEPVPSGVGRADLGLPVERPVVLVTFDHLSLTERKHPLGAIDAFRRAFPEPTDDGPVLVVKTVNADRRWREHERVRLAAADRPDILVVDRMLSRGDQSALIAHADVLLSLHRSEGLGLHLVEAMWLGTPTIATRYSGNLSFMDDTNSLLVDATLVPVARTEGFYPPEAMWAEPDLDQAAAHLRRLLGDADLRSRLAVAGRARVERQPSFETTGRTIAAWLGIEER